MTTPKEINAAGTKANAGAEKALAHAKDLLREQHDTVTTAYVEGHIGGGDAAELLDLADVAYGKCAEALAAVRAFHKRGTKVAVKVDPDLAPVGTYADLPPLNEGVPAPKSGGR